MRKLPRSRITYQRKQNLEVTEKEELSAGEVFKKQPQPMP